MKIKIKSDDELGKLLDALAVQIVDAHIYHKLYCDLLDARADHQRELRQSNTFWHLTFVALKEARLSRLCRVFDQHTNSLNLVNLLDTIKSNLELFEADQFRKRLEGNAFVESLSDSNRVPSKEQLNTDIEYCSSRNPIVKKVLVWRNNIVAHQGAKVSMGKREVLEQSSLSKDEIEELLEESLKIYNRYSTLYRSSTWSSQIIGHDDYKSLLKFVGDGLDKWEEDLEKERKKFNE